jgi:hypothetical protein
MFWEINGKLAIASVLWIIVLPCRGVFYGKQKNIIEQDYGARKARVSPKYELFIYKGFD